MMGKIKLSSLIFLLLIFSVRSLSSQVFNIEYSDLRHTFTIQSELVKIKSKWIPPSINKLDLKGNWNHIGSSVIYDKLAGIPGSRTSDFFSYKNIEIERTGMDLK